MSTKPPRIVIIGAGPTGIGAAWRLVEHGHPDWLLFDAADHAGGLASSIVDDAGFTWDLGGHVLFSHYRYFDRLMQHALGDAWIEHEREAWIWIRDRWVPYPFQNNLWRLPPDDVAAAIDGLLLASGWTHSTPSANFREWLLRSFGPGLCDLFMFPYNRKVWAFDPAALGVGWMGERVAQINVAHVQRNVRLKQDDVSWGPNATFRFPRTGGTGAIWRSLCSQLPAERIRLGRRVVRIESRARLVCFADGTVEPYDALISTMPLDRLLRSVIAEPVLRDLAERFVHSSSHIVGVGLDGPVPEALRTKCWMYFPEPDVPFYRVTVFSNYAPNNVPRPGAQWSLLAEVSESSEKSVDAFTVVDDVIAGFRTAGLIDDTSRIVSRWRTRLEHGYPTPWLGRAAVLAQIEPRLRDLGIYSRGRFGAWKYEASNQDHSVMQGVEAVDNILLGVAEKTMWGHTNAEPPALVNAHER